MVDTQRTSHWESVAWVAMILSAAFLILSIFVIMVGGIYQVDESSGFLGALFSDGLALLWITAAGTAHFVFVPALCATIAFRDRRREREGKPIPKPRSVWSGHESVFGAGGESNLSR